MKTSLIYSHIYFYRLLMNILYGGKYHRRFLNITELIGHGVNSVCDICFGDTHIAKWCCDRDIQWTGIDLNHHFCKQAQSQGFNAIEGDIFALELPEADVYIMAGSLYHFHDKLSSLFDRILRRTNCIIISEPIRNMSSMGGVFGWWAKYSANPGSGNARFRYNQQTLLAELVEQQESKGFDYRVVSINRDILIEINR